MDLCPKAKEKEKINKWDLIKHKSFCITQETSKKTKRQPTEWKKIFDGRKYWSKDMTNTGLIFKIYMQLTQFNIKKQLKMHRRRE